MSNLGMVPLGISGQHLLSDSLCIQGFDHGLGLITPINPIMTGITLEPPDAPLMKEIIHYNSCTLFPQNPNLPPPSTRERPPGCKTVFVGGLPENASEEIIKEVLDQCGEITALRKSKKNFCHIRFSEEFMVDKALYLSGYRMCIGSSTDKKDSGRIHVDFAQARDDLYEWECRQRLLAREERHKHIHEDHLSPPSPLPITHYSEHEAASIGDRLKDDHNFTEATAVLFTWIDRGEVNRRTANNFYSMIQSTNSHVRRLMSEKAHHEEQMELAKESFKNALLAILSQFEQITAVFTAATRQKAWDHFSKAQRKNIDIWRKQCEELRNAHNEEIMGICREEEMEMSDDDSDEGPCKKMCMEENGVSDQTSMSLKEENDSLRWQLDAYRNEVELLREQQRRTNCPDNALQHTQICPDNTAQHTQICPDNTAQHTQICPDNTAQHTQICPDNTAQHTQICPDNTAQHTQICPDNMAQHTQMHSPKGQLQMLQQGMHNIQQGINGCEPSLYTRDRRSETLIRGAVTSQKEALLLGIISTFLHVHPFGASIEYLWSYIQRLDSKVSAGELEQLMMSLPSMFKQEVSGVGAMLEKRWKFCGFDNLGTA